MTCLIYKCLITFLQEIELAPHTSMQKRHLFVSMTDTYKHVTQFFCYKFILLMVFKLTNYLCGI